MALARWVSFTDVFFDCDGTLCAVEGIVELARWRGLEAEILALTEAAMAGVLPLEAVYAARLRRIQPSREELRRLARLYAERLVPDAEGVIRALQACGVSVHLLSAGLEEAVRPLGRRLGLPPEHIHAVPVRYDPFAGLWWHRDAVLGPAVAPMPSPLTTTAGKAAWLERWRVPGRRLILVGDGVTDLMAQPAVHLFVGFGGVFRRERVATEAAVYLTGASLAPVLPLALSPERAARLRGTPAEEVLCRGLQAFQTGEARFRDPERQARFLAAWESAWPEVA